MRDAIQNREEYQMKQVKIVLEVELPNDYNENEVDVALADTIAALGGGVLDSKEFEEIQ